MTPSFIGKVLDNYRILERLGVGGMGMVFKAIHIKLDKIFALKIIAPGLAMNEKFITRFQTEAKSLARFEDPNIVRIYDLRSAEDQWFIVMEFVEGVTLSDKINQEGAIPWKKALPMMQQMLGAIGHAHEAGIIHRDIKPNNIMLTPEGQVKITDFGLAKDQTSGMQTATITSGGTLFYMSPEHVKGFSFIDARSDLYSLGMTFYEMLSGSVPFKNINSDFEIRESILKKEFEPLCKLNAEIPVELESLVQKAINKNPDERYQTADDISEDIHIIEAKYGMAPDRKAAAVRRKKTTRTVSAEQTERPSALREKSKKSKKRSSLVLGIVTTIILICTLYIYKTPIVSMLTNLTKNDNLATLTITTNPAAAYVILNGDTVGNTPLRAHRVEPGEHVLSIGRENHLPIDTSIVLKQGSDLGLVFSLRTVLKKQEPDLSKIRQPTPKTKPKPLLASLSIRSDPPAGEIWMNGKMRGKTPLYLNNLKPGNYTIQIRNNNYNIYNQDIKLDAGNNQLVNAILVPFTGSIHISREPSTASLFLDGKLVDYPDVAIVELSDIVVGEHVLEITQNGYSSYKADVVINRDEVFNINARLERLLGDLSFQVRPWGSIYINEQLQKSSADIKYVVQLPVDEYDIKIVHPTLGRWQKKVRIEANKTKDLTINFTRKFMIKVIATDMDGSELPAEIFLDGKPTGITTPGEIETSVGMHEIGVKKAGYSIAGELTEILIDEDSDRSLTIKLSKSE